MEGTDGDEWLKEKRGEQIAAGKIKGIQGSVVRGQNEGKPERKHMKNEDEGPSGICGGEVTVASKTERDRNRERQRSEQRQ